MRASKNIEVVEVEPRRRAVRARRIRTNVGQVTFDAWTAPPADGVWPKGRILMRESDGTYWMSVPEGEAREAFAMAFPDCKVGLWDREWMAFRAA